MRTWSAKGLSLHYGDELVALLDFEPCPFTDSWDSLDSLMQFIVDACNAAEAAQERPDIHAGIRGEDFDAPAPWSETNVAGLEVGFTPRTPVDASKLRVYEDA